MVLIRLITIDDVRRAADLVRAHYDEIVTKKRLRQLDPDWVAYRAYEEAGRLFVLGAFDGDALVGYSVNIDVPAHLHHRPLHYAINDGLFVSPSARKRGVGGKLMVASKREAKRLGAAEFLWHTQKGADLQAVLEKRHAELVDFIYAEEL